MAKITDYRTHLLQTVQEWATNLKGLRDPDGLITPLREALLRFRDSVHSGPDLRDGVHLETAWRRLERILEYHEPHHIKEDWWKAMDEGFNLRIAEAAREIARLKYGSLS
jgi:hypothetical protein